MSAPDHARWSEDIGAYLLGALPDAEREGFERHLASCPECRHEVEELAVAADALPSAAPPRHAAARAQAADHVRRRGRGVAARRGRQPRRRARGGGSAARAPELLRAPLGLPSRVRPRRLGAAAGGRRRRRRARRRRRRRADGDRPGGGHGGRRAGEAGRRQERLAARDDPLPAAARGRVYQVWTLRKGQSPQPTNVLWTPLADGSATVSVPGSLDGVQNVLVSAEPARRIGRADDHAGGQRQPELTLNRPC